MNWLIELCLVNGEIVWVTDYNVKNMYYTNDREQAWAFFYEDAADVVSSHEGWINTECRSASIVEKSDAALLRAHAE